ncbi:hypothetical protein ABW19_dt0204030 [Dactylella cylindrospora]|nr:hypothetical protein ABW19_dt0204030 [Dactylella cylindrospora]
MDRAYTLEELANWPKGNYINPDLYGHYLPSVEATLLALSSATVILRLFTRGILFRSFGIDDAVIIPAWGFAILDSVSHLRSLQFGWGRHMWDVDWRQAPQILFWQWVNGWAFSFTVMFTKISILCFYLRFARELAFRRLIYITLAFLVTWSVGLAIPMIVQCQPIEGAWSFITSVKAKCISNKTNEDLNLAQGCLNLLSDIILFCLPLQTVWSLKRPKKERAALIGLFALGLLVCIFAGLRLKAMYKTFDGDQTWYGYELWLWVSLEVHIGIIIASLPGVKPLFVMLLRKIPYFHKPDPTLVSTPEIKFATHHEGEDLEDISSKSSITGLDPTNSKPDPQILRALRSMGTKLTKTFSDEKDFATKTHKTAKSYMRSRSATLNLSFGKDDEELAIPAQCLGGIVVYKSTEIVVTHESAVEMEDLNGSYPNNLNPNNALHITDFDHL